MNNQEIHVKRISHAYKWVGIYGLGGLVSLAMIIIISKLKSNSSLLDMKSSGTNFTLGKYLQVIYAHQLTLICCYMYDAYQYNLWTYGDNPTLNSIYLIFERFIQTILGISSFAINCIGLDIIVNVFNNAIKQHTFPFVLIIISMGIQYYLSVRSILCFYIKQIHEFIIDEKTGYEEFDNYV